MQIHEIVEMHSILDSDSSIPWEAIGTIAGTLAASALAAWKKWGVKWVKSRKERTDHKRTLDNARRFSEMAHLSRSWRAREGAMRVLVLYARDSGKPWRPEDPLKVSCLMQATAEGVKDTWNRWQDWVVDQPYREFLGDLLHSMDSQRPLMLATDTMPDGVLKDAYEAQGTCASVVFGVKWLGDENAMVYVSLNFGRQVDVEHPMTDEEKSTYKLQAQQLWNSRDKVRSMAEEGKHVWKSR